MLLLRCAGLAKLTPRLALSVLGMSCGVVIASVGELRFNMYGIAAMLLSELAEGGRCVLKERIMKVIEPPMGILETLVRRRQHN